MATHSAKRTLTGEGQYITVKIPNTLLTYALVLAVAGTYVGQLVAESRDLDGDWDTEVIDDAIGVAIDGTYTDQMEANAEGLFAGRVVAGEDEVRVRFYSYTSGEAAVSVALIPDLD